MPYATVPSQAKRLSGREGSSVRRKVGASRLVNRNITAGAGRTSMRLEPEVWDALREICLREGLELRELIRRLEDNAYDGGRTSAVRVHVLEYFRRAATEEGHQRSGHGRGMRHEGMSAGMAAGGSAD
jgi:predicted DNA-binding ribbon-helix-helix protein